MNETKDPVLSARVDALMLAFVTLAKLNPNPLFESALLANKETWRDLLIASSIPESYLDELDGQIDYLLGAIRG